MTSSSLTDTDTDSNESCAPLAATAGCIGIAPEQLHAFEQALATALDFDAGCPEAFADAMRYVLLAPGKRLRPQLVMLAAQACGGEVLAAMPMAMAVEMIHAYSLVHDDLPAMDDDDLRRGRPTCHKKYDEATAVLVGDALQARAFDVLATSVQPPAKAAQACAMLAQAAGAEALVGGQFDDLAAEFSEIDLRQLELVHARKTGALFRVSLRLGGLAADASEEQFEALDQYGAKLGLAFQIRDDLLDVEGEESQVGKRLSKDGQRGKSTYPALLGVDESRAYAQRLIDHACEAICLLGESGLPLEQLARRIGQRDR